MTTDLRAAATGLRTGEQALPPEGVAAVAECMATQRAIRRLSTEPVDRALVDFVVAAASRAASGGNRQPWRFVIVTDPALRNRVGDWYRLGWDEYRRQGLADLRDGADATARRSIDAAAHLAATIQDAPVIVVPCFLVPRWYPRPHDFFSGSSIFPAVQNLILAARAVGLGTTLTTMQALSPELLDGLRALLDVPMTAVPAAVLPLGWPAERFGPTTRKPVEEISYSDTWGRPWA